MKKEQPFIQLLTQGKNEGQRTKERQSKRKPCSELKENRGILKEATWKNLKLHHSTETQ